VSRPSRDRFEKNRRVLNKSPNSGEIHLKKEAVINASRFLDKPRKRVPIAGRNKPAARGLNSRVNKTLARGEYGIERDGDPGGKSEGQATARAGGLRERPSRGTLAKKQCKVRGVEGDPPSQLPKSP